MEAAELAAHSEELADQGHDCSAISLEESLRSTETIRDRVEGDSSILDAVKSGYSLDPILTKVLAAPTAFPQFKVEQGRVYDSTR